jgi:hypothetical protein
MNRLLPELINVPPAVFDTPVQTQPHAREGDVALDE